MLHNRLVKKRKIICDISNYAFQNNRNIKVSLNHWTNFRLPDQFRHDAGSTAGHSGENRTRKQGDALSIVRMKSSAS